MNINNDNLYDIADKKTKSRVNTYIQEWKDKGFLIGYFGILAKNIYNRTRVKNSEILELLIYGAYIEEQSKLNEYEKQIMYDDVNYYYEQGEQEVLKTQRKKKPISIIDMALFLYILEQAKLEQYIQMTIQYNAQQIYKQVLINIQQQKELEIENNEFQRIINQQQNAKLCINNDKISGFMDNQLIGLNNEAKIEGIKKIDKNAKVRFIAITDGKETDMCHSLDGQIFYINEENEFNRYYGETKNDLRIQRVKCKGLVIGLNLPPISHHFHWCRSTITYLVEDYKKYSLEYKDITNKMLKRIKFAQGKTINQDFIVKNGITYNVKGKEVIFEPTLEEIKCADILSKTFGKDVIILPKVNIPQNIKSADYLFENQFLDLKTINKKNKEKVSKDAIYNSLKNCKEQANNFVIDISKYYHEIDEVYNQINKIYTEPHRNWVDKIYILKDENIIKVFQRKK